jgi:hypothetical protein
MATLQFKGKSAVWNHHLSVPYHTLEKDAKKSLLPTPRLRQAGKGTDADPSSRAKLATGQANEKNQTLLDRFRVLIKDTRFFDVGV